MEYAKRNIIAQGKHYLRHIMAMTQEGLHDKGDIAAELAHRDERIAALEADLTQAVQMYTDVAGERDKAIADLADLKVENKALRAARPHPSGRSHALLRGIKIR